MHVAAGVAAHARATMASGTLEEVLRPRGRRQRLSLLESSDESSDVLCSVLPAHRLLISPFKILLVAFCLLLVPRFFLPFVPLFRRPFCFVCSAMLPAGAFEAGSSTGGGFRFESSAVLSAGALDTWSAACDGSCFMTSSAALPAGALETWAALAS